MWYIQKSTNKWWWVQKVENEIAFCTKGLEEEIPIEIPISDLVLLTKENKHITY
jgi:hypothetical protein